MGKRINTDELEDYLKNVADGHRMYASNQIWTNIRENLHGTTRWPALTFISLFIITSLVIGTVFIKPDETILKQIASASIAETQTKAADTKAFRDKLDPQRITSETVLAYTSDNSVASPQPETETTPDYKPVDTQIAGTINRNNSTLNLLPQIFVNGPSLTIRQPINPEIISEEDKKTAAQEIVVDTKLVEDKQNTLTLNTVVKLPKTKNSRWFVSYYITPSSSFRLIKDDNRTKFGPYNILPANPGNGIDVNEVIRHKPAMGVEAGFSFGYKLTKNLALKAGLQFNIRQYNIEAYRSTTEWVPLTLNNGRHLDTINTISNYRNDNGSSEITLTNKYHEISFPVGVEFSKNLSKNLSWGVAGAVQPTYVFDKNAYLISNDYKSYTMSTPIFRNWNVNTAVEAFIAYKAGKYTWRLGPQIRYQQLSSYNGNYPIKENLYDYGVKIGFTKTIR